MKVAISLFVLVLLTMTAHSQNVSPLDGKCYIIGHRGAPGYGGENTLFGFNKALELGADGFELDVIPTEDGQLIVGHDFELNRLIGEEQLEALFPTKKKGKKWFVTDFTQTELQTLKVTYPAPDQEPYDYKSLGENFKMPTLSAALDLLIEARSTLNRSDLKIYIEIKTKEKYMHTLSLEEISNQVKSALSDKNLINDKNVWIQSFDYDMMDVVANEAAFSELAKCQLAFDNPTEITKFRSKKSTKKFLKKKIIKRNLQMVHLWKVPVKMIVGRNIPLVELAHKKNIPVHLYTFRDPQYESDYKSFKAMGLKGFESKEDELAYYMNLGVDAVMTDYISSAIKVRDEISN